VSTAPRHAGTIAITPGGSGGHVVPALATPDALLARGYTVLFFTDKRGERFISQRAGLHVHVIAGASPSGGLVKIARGVLALGAGFAGALAAMARARPRAMIGFGSYASFSACVAARTLGVPLFLHEQNAVLGRANETLHRLARLVITSVPKVEGIERVPASKVVMAGYPIRASVAELAARPYPAPQADGPLEILSIGGSQGAQVFGDVLPAALARLEPALRARVRLTLQARAERVEQTRAELAALGVAADVAAFFDDVPERLAKAQLVISRSGMSTVAEVLAAGRPAFFVPLPHGHRLEQYKNPAAAVEAGGAWLVDQQDFTPEWLSSRLERMLRGEIDLAAMARIARALGKPQAAQAVAATVVDQLAACSR
jgi:UDP-N-acetylglucosamine--N-acetylmuramyl-(pentapeptide) pyrophosphoryl-undecaprenol N-acetylglucosamine transferase